MTGTSSSDPVPYVAACGVQVLASASCAPVTVAAAVLFAPSPCPALDAGAGLLPPGMNGATTKAVSGISM
ncbi:MAG TPA: hypothetical protein VIJ56_10705, partial [Acidimicrobiales bacterium]